MTLDQGWANCGPLNILAVLAYTLHKIKYGNIEHKKHAGKYHSLDKIAKFEFYKHKPIKDQKY